MLTLTVAAACGPRAHIPALSSIPGPAFRNSQPAQPVSDAEADSLSRLARVLAPVLYLQPNETFPLERVVAVLHPERRVIAYHLLWRDDANGSWIPFTVPTDEELVWVGYDSTLAPTEIWTYWHGTLLHTGWRDRGPPTINVQWGKHGSLPRGVVESDLPGARTMNLFYAFSWLSMPDMLLGRLTRPGPLCFCRSYRSYRDFSRPLLVGPRINAITRAVDASALLREIFGRRYSRKTPWPPESPAIR